MLKTILHSEQIFYVGADDKTLDLFESQYPVPDGVSYNAYVIRDEKTALLDTVDPRATNQWLEQVTEVLDGTAPDYLVISHMEPDHAGSIRAITEHYPDMTLVGSAKALGMLPQFLGDMPGNPTRTVKEGETLELGNHYLMSKEELENKIATLTGGRAAEEVVFHSITTGASNDIEQATKLARAMLTRYGMSKDFDMVALEIVNNQYLGGDTSLACSAQTQREIDQKVVELVKAQHEKAVRILTDNRAKLDELAQYLYQKETITGEEFMEILNREPAQAQ